MIVVVLGSMSLEGIGLHLLFIMEFPFYKIAWSLEKRCSLEIHVHQPKDF